MLYTEPVYKKTTNSFSRPTRPLQYKLSQCTAWPKDMGDHILLKILENFAFYSNTYMYCVQLCIQQYCILYIV